MWSSDHMKSYNVSCLTHRCNSYNTDVTPTMQMDVTPTTQMDVTPTTLSVQTSTRPFSTPPSHGSNSQHVTPTGTALYTHIYILTVYSTVYPHTTYIYIYICEHKLHIFVFI